MGEQMAVDHLLTCGYQIVHRNYRVARLEVDIIASKGDTLYFVEVKCRHVSPDCSSDFMPERAMTAAKRARIERAAELYIQSNPHQGDIFIELVAITFCNGNHTLAHYKHNEY